MNEYQWTQEDRTPELDDLAENEAADFAADNDPAQLRARIAELTATNDRQALMIYAKDRQIAELTRMLFALGKQDGQTIRAQAAEIAQLTEKVRYAYVQIAALEAR